MQANTNERRFKRPSDILKERVSRCRPFPKGLAPLIAKRYPQYDSLVAGYRVRNVLALRTADIELTDIIESLCKELRGVASN